MFKVDISKVLEFVKDKSYSDIVKESQKYGLCVKYSNDEQLKNLFLLANKNEGTENKKTENKKTENETTENETTENETTENKKTENKKTENDIINYQANGIIFEKSTNKVVAMCQNKLVDCDSDFIFKSGTVKRIEYCEDGTMIKLYNYNGTWYTSTTRCIDASKSYWNSTKSFSDLFWDVFDKSLLDTLDKQYTYVFVLLHKENRIVVRHKINMLVYISRINNETYIEDYTQQFNNVYGIRRPKKLDINININEFHPFKRGILIKTFNKENNQLVSYKIDYKNYTNIKSLRGNIPDVRMRYLELLPEPELLKQFEKNYYEYKFMFNIIKNEIFNLVKMIYRLYVDSHIKHSIQVNDDNLYYKTLKQLHAQYKITNVPISFYEVQKKIFTMDKKIVKRLLMWEDLKFPKSNKNKLNEMTNETTNETTNESVVNESVVNESVVNEN